MAPMKRCSWLLFPFVALLLLCVRVDGQAASSNPSNDPYKNFVGHWAGRIVVNHEDMPATVKITVTEAKDGRGMSWDYVFGSVGEKGYKLATKSIVLKPAEERMTMHFEGNPEQTYLTVGLERAVQDGFGQFSASDCNTHKQCSICIFDLRPTSLSYQWKTTSDGKNFDIYSEFVLMRAVDPSQTTETPQKPNN